MVLLPPLGADHRFFDPLARHLDQQLWTADVAPGRHAASLREVADQLAGELIAGVGGPSVVLGVSMGGLVAQHLAAGHPAVVSHLVLADTTVRYPEPMRRMWRERAAQVEAHGTGAVVDATLTTWFGAGGRDDLAPARQLGEQMVRDTPPGRYVASCRALAASDTTDAVAAIGAPTLVMCGEHDGEVFRSAAQLLASQLAGAEVAWITGAHHAAVLERPREVAALVAQLLDRGGGS